MSSGRPAFLFIATGFSDSLNKPTRRLSSLRREFELCWRPTAMPAIPIANSAACASIREWRFSRAANPVRRSFPAARGKPARQGDHTCRSKLKMPMGGNKLKDNEIADLKYWIQTMAAFWPTEDAKQQAASTVVQAPKFTIRPDQRNFWSFQPIQKSAPPTVKDAGWLRLQLIALSSPNWRRRD